jgi:hypothetical protein
MQADLAAWSKTGRVFGILKREDLRDSPQVVRHSAPHPSGDYMC